MPRDGARPDRSVGSGQRRRLPRRVPLLHRSEQVRRPRLPVTAQPGVGAVVRRERHSARAGRRRRPDLARRGRFPARADHRPPGANRLRRLRLARGAQSSTLAGRSRSRRRPGPSGSAPRAGPLAVSTDRTTHREGPLDVVRGDPPTPRGRLPRRAILRLARLRADRTGGTGHGARFAPRAGSGRAKSHSAS